MTDEPGTEIEKAPEPERALTPLELQWKFAQRVCHTEFVPVAFKGRPDAVLAAITYGGELGIGPMQSLQSLHVIQGKPTLSAEAMRARVYAAGHTIETLRYDDEMVTLKGTRDTGATAEVSFGMDDARRAGLLNNPTWKKYPRAMLLARATSELCRLLFPDVIAGASYVPEELGGENPPPDDADIIEISGAEPSAESLAPAEVEGGGSGVERPAEPPALGATVADDHGQFFRAEDTSDVTEAEIVEVVGHELSPEAQQVVAAALAAEAVEPEPELPTRPALAPVLEARRNVTPPPCDDDLNAELIGKMRAPALAKAALRNGISTANKTPDDLRAALLELVSE